ncbi:NAD(P)H-binding protein [Micromonospora sp. CA-248212]|uniref:NAD(P)H-binding protein n=1 Tax=Micromonospora sp. CA-248212 TaxID=3239961 RepID=UPI003D89F7CE
MRASSGIEWTLVRAVTLTDKPTGGTVRAAEAGTEKPGARINRADLARFLVQTIEDDAWTRKAPLVWSTPGCPLPTNLSIPDRTSASTRPRLRSRYWDSSEASWRCGSSIVRPTRRRTSSTVSGAPPATPRRR